MQKTRIALDAMGGDQAPDAVLAGTLLACDPLGGLRIAPERVLLVGDRERIEPRLAELGGDPGVEILHASQVIGMHEHPATALRAKRDSSISRCVQAVAEGAAGGLISMGNTGAVVGASTLGLGTLPGVRRPGIAVTLDLTGQPVTLIDMGANIVPKPQHLYQYGVMGAVYMRDCLGTAKPRVALLNIGEESSKGTEVLREAHALLEESSLEFVGNIEGGDLFQGIADVVVSDGFTGNVVLKLMEGFAGFMLGLVLRELKAHDVTWGPEALARVERNIDYSAYGGALLLGVSGIVVIGHGRSGAQAVANAISLAARTLDAGVNEDIVRGLESGAREATT